MEVRPLYAELMIIFTTFMVCASSTLGGNTTNFARVYKNKTTGVWWLKRGNETEQLSLGIVAVQYTQFRDWRTGVSRYQQYNDKRFKGNHTAWADASVSLMEKLGFNTMGCWSDLEANAAASRADLMYTPGVGIGWAASDGYKHFPDVFSPTFAGNASLVAKERVAPYAGDPALVGWFSDNELPWWMEYRAATGRRADSTGTNLLWQFLSLLGRGSPGWTEAHQFLKSRLRESHPALKILEQQQALTEEQDRLLFESTITHEPAFAYNVSRAYFSQVGTRMSFLCTA